MCWSGIILCAVTFGWWIIEIGSMASCFWLVFVIGSKYVIGLEAGGAEQVKKKSRTQPPGVLLVFGWTGRTALKWWPPGRLSLYSWPVTSLCFSLLRCSLLCYSLLRCVLQSCQLKLFCMFAKLHVPVIPPLSFSYCFIFFYCNYCMWSSPGSCRGRSCWFSFFSFLCVGRPVSYLCFIFICKYVNWWILCLMDWRCLLFWSCFFRRAWYPLLLNIFLRHAMSWSRQRATNPLYCASDFPKLGETKVSFPCLHLSYPPKSIKKGRHHHSPLWMASVLTGVSPLWHWGYPRSVYTCTIYQSPLAPCLQAIPIPLPSGTGGESLSENGIHFRRQTVVHWGGGLSSHGSGGQSAAERGSSLSKCLCILCLVASRWCCLFILQHLWLSGSLSYVSVNQICSISLFLTETMMKIWYQHTDQSQQSFFVLQLNWMQSHHLLESVLSECAMSLASDCGLRWRE